MEKNRGIKRLLCAMLYSWKGFRSAVKNEVAFQQEFMAFIPLVIISFLLDVSPFERLLMISTLMLVMIVEVINSAIETVVDRVSTDTHKLSGRAKDYGSLAVCMSIIIAVASWLTVLFG